MKLDESKILDEIQKLKFQGLSKSEVLFELLGGEQLNEIFDQHTIESIMSNFVNTNQLHPLVTGMGLDVLEGLLNKKIVGDMEQFYNLKPEYILSLSPEQQALMAKALAGDNKSQEDLLITSWNKGLKTCACGGESEHQYMMFEVDSDNANQVAMMQQISEIYGDGMQISLGEGNLQVAFYGEDKTFYDKIKDAINLERQPDRFTTALLEIVNYNNAFYSSIIEGKDNEIGELTKALEGSLEENVNLQNENQALKNKIANIKEWITKRLAKIPLVGKAILRSMEKEEKLLHENNEVER